MLNIYKTLWLGSAVDYENLKNKQDWYIMHMTKEPYHREMAGMYNKDLPKSDPNYYWVENKNRCAFNLLDLESFEISPKPIFDKAVSLINEKISNGDNVLVHCTFGRSRSNAVVLLYLATHTDFFKSKDLLSIEKEFILVYPNYKPSIGIRSFLVNNWNKYMGSSVYNEKK